jgi:hypothetical protein
MRKLSTILAVASLACLTPEEHRGEADSALISGGASLSFLAQAQDYRLLRSSSYDRSGGNADCRAVAPGATLVLLDAAGPGMVTHVWMTVADHEDFALKKLVLRMYWDGEETPSVLTPLGDFFGLGLGDYVPMEAAPIVVAPNRALNTFFPMPFDRHALIAVTNEGSQPVRAFYFGVDYRALSAPLPAGTLRFHAQYRQAAPCVAVRGDGKNVTGADNYVWLEAEGRGHFVGVTMSVIERAHGWWGEGDDMFFVDGEDLPSIHGTGTEDYFLGAWDFGGKAFSLPSFGAPVVGRERDGAGWSLYRFHLDSPIPFTRSLRATIEHGHANDRADDYSSVAYWYQTEPHARFPPLPSVDERVAPLRH